MAELATTEVGRTTSREDLDEALQRLAERRREFARLVPGAKAILLRALVPRVVEASADWVRAACAAKGIPAGSPAAAEEWYGGPVVLARHLRLLGDSLAAIARDGRPALGRGHRRRHDGRLEVDVFPAGPFDRLLLSPFRARVHLEPGIDAARARREQAPFYRRSDPDGGTCLVLGAGNVSAIPATDVLHKGFVEGQVCLLKMNPVNAYLGPIFARVLEPLIARDFLRIAYGGGDVGSTLCTHPLVDTIHITGSDRTHDAIVWGAPGPEQEERKRRGEPRLEKPITSELGNVSPVIVTPHAYAARELDFMAHNVATMVTNNASFNCNAAKMIVTSERWPQREAFLSALGAALAEVPTRLAYYPGADERYDALTDGRRGVERHGAPVPGHLPWTVIRDVDPRRVDDPLFRTEPFCAIVSETALPEADPLAFLHAAAHFANERLWGTLNATLVVPDTLRQAGGFARELDRVVDALRYGTVAINHWPALAYGFITPAWGGHPSATLRDVQSGLGWVHNTFMIEGIEKTFVEGPLRVRPKPGWFHDHRTATPLARRMAAFEAAPSWAKLPGIVATALVG